MPSRNETPGTKAPWDMRGTLGNVDTFWKQPSTSYSNMAPRTENPSPSSDEVTSFSYSPRSVGDTPPTSPFVNNNQNTPQLHQIGAALSVSHVQEATIKLENSLRRLEIQKAAAPVPVVTNSERSEHRQSFALTQGTFGRSYVSKAVAPPQGSNRSGETKLGWPQFKTNELSDPLSTSVKMLNQVPRPRAYNVFAKYAEGRQDKNKGHQENKAAVRAVPESLDKHQEGKEIDHTTQMRQVIPFKKDLAHAVWHNQVPVAPQHPAQYGNPPAGPLSVRDSINFYAPTHKFPSSGPVRMQRFRPMQALANKNHNLPLPSHFHGHAPPSPPLLPPSLALVPSGPTSHPISAKFSRRYHGVHNEANASAEHISDEENCALWLTNLPPDVTYTELLALIAPTGRVYCTYINEPDFAAHHTAAAKVVYFEPAAAQRLLSASWTRGLVLRGHAVRVKHNRIKTAAQPVLKERLSRVLLITGASSFVNPESLVSYFEELFLYQVDSVTELIRAGGRSVVEFRFASYRCQAQMGKMALERNKPAGFLKAEFGQDPCEVGETFVSYGVAAERIQGKGI